MAKTNFNSNLKNQWLKTINYFKNHFILNNIFHFDYSLVTINNFATLFFILASRIFTLASLFFILASRIFTLASFFFILTSRVFTLASSLLPRHSCLSHLHSCLPHLHSCLFLLASLFLPLTSLFSNLRPQKSIFYTKSNKSYCFVFC